MPRYVRTPRSVLAAVTAAALFAAGCSSGSDSGERPAGDGASASAGEQGTATPAPDRQVPEAHGSVTVERTVTTDLTSPWGLAPLPGGDLLVSSRDTGKILRVDVASGEKTVIGSVPGTDPGGEGGLLGIALPPDNARMVYAYVTTASDNRVVRMVYDPKEKPGNQLGAPDTIFKGIPKGAIHNGGRIAFGPDGMLYVSTGETGQRGLAQDRESPAGKILRMTPEGEVPESGNPWPDSVVYSMGHRNVQGLAWDEQGRLWASEFGQDTWDELNLIKPGGNYGWPEVEGKANREGFVDPVLQWRPAEASPSGIAMVEGSVWMACLRGERLWRVPLRGTEPVAEPEAFLKGEYGRLRTVAPAGEGGLWLVTSETDGRGTPREKDDRILRLTVS